MIRRIFDITAALLLTTSLVACAPIRKPEESKAESVDNFMRADGKAVTRNVCGIEDEFGVDARTKIQSRTKSKLQIDLTYAQRIGSPDPTYAQAVLQTLVAVPAALGEPFFQAGGRIEIKSDVVTFCDGLLTSVADRKFAAEGGTRSESCWQQPKKGSAPVVYLPANEKAIRHNLLRTMAFVYTEFFVDRLQRLAAGGKSSSGEWKAALAEFVRERDRIGDALITDAKRINPAGAARLVDLRKSDKTKFGNVAVAEAIDSYYCSVKTHRAFESTFFATYAAFAGEGGSEHALGRQLGTPPMLQDE